MIHSEIDVLNFSDIRDSSICKTNNKVIQVLTILHAERQDQTDSSIVHQKNSANSNAGGMLMMI